MTYLIRVGEKPTYWSGKKDAVWVNQVAEAKEYSTKKEIEKDIKEISEAWGYSTLNAVKIEDATSVDLLVEVVEGEEEAVSVVDPSLTAEDLRRIHS
jgi:rubrerythrin